MNFLNSASSPLAKTALLAAIAGSSFTAQAEAQSYKLTRYLDSGAQVPDQPAGVVFSRFDNETPSQENGLLCFEGSFIDPAGNFREGVFVVDAQGQVTRVVLSTDLAPTGSFSSIDNEQLQNGLVTWKANGAQGIYGRELNPTSPIQVIADTTSVIPDGSGQTFRRFGEYGHHGGLVFFEGQNQSFEEGVYLANLATGALSVVADKNSPSPFPSPPGTTLRDSFSEPMIRDGRFTVRASDTSGVSGLLTNFGSGIVVPVNTTVASPSGLGNFAGFDESSIDGEKVVWQGSTANGSAFGVYMYDHSTGAFTTIADETTPHPDGGFFDVFNGNPSISVENGVTTVIWEADEDQWAWIDGVRIPVARVGDVIDGKTVTDVTARFPYAVTGTTTAVNITFADGTRSLYRAALNNGSFSTFGVGCPANLPLSLSVDSAPCAGQTTTVTCANVPSTASATQLVIGTGPAIQFPLDSLGMVGCTLYIQNALFAIDPLPGSLDFPIAIPADPAAVGAQFNCQAATLALGVNSFGVALSDLGEFTVGG